MFVELQLRTSSLERPGGVLISVALLYPLCRLTVYPLTYCHEGQWPSGSNELLPPGGDPGGELTGMYVPRVGPHLEDGNLRESHHDSHDSRVPTCLSRDSLQLWFSRGRLDRPSPSAKILLGPVIGPKIF